MDLETGRITGVDGQSSMIRQFSSNPATGITVINMPSWVIPPGVLHYATLSTGTSWPRSISCSRNVSHVIVSRLVSMATGAVAVVSVRGERHDVISIAGRKYSIMSIGSSL